MDERNAFLANIRKELGVSSSESRGPDQCPSVFASKDICETISRIRNRTSAERQTLLRQFQENAAQVNLTVHVDTSFAGAARTIISIVQDSEPEFSEIRQIIQHDHPDIKALHLSEKLAAEAVAVHTTSLADSGIREKTIDSYIGITSPSWGVADSATIVQLTLPGQPRSTSLVPSIHIGVIRIENILADLSELYARLRQNPPSSSAVFITGPSKTGDIEAHLVFGAHGPKIMHIVVIDEQMDQ